MENATVLVVAARGIESQSFGGKREKREGKE